MIEPKRRRLPLTGLGLIGAGGVLGVALGMPGAAQPRVSPTLASTALLAERLDRTVAAGRLTRGQADAILTSAEAGLLNGDFVGGPGGRPGPAIDRQPAR